MASNRAGLLFEGPLSKWTNVVSGWQYRWFVLDQSTGLLSYYTVPGLFGVTIESFIILEQREDD